MITRGENLIFSFIAEVLGFTCSESKRRKYLKSTRSLYVVLVKKSCFLVHLLSYLTFFSYTIVIFISRMDLAKIKAR